MRPDLHIGSLTVAGLRPARDPRALVARLGLEPRSEERRVLLVRRLRVSADAPQDGRRRLAALWSTAAQPARGPVDDNTPAVLFRDEAEALACLSADVLTGAASGRWWWRRRLPRHTVTVSDTLAALWAAEPRWAPAAIAHLHRLAPERCAAALAGVTEPAARDLLRAVVAEHLPDLPVPSSALRPPPHPPSTALPTSPASSTATKADPPAEPRPPTTAEVLLEVALTIDERPAETRTARFAAWLAAPHTPRAPAGPLLDVADSPVPTSGPSGPTGPTGPATGRPAEAEDPRRVVPLHRAPAASSPEAGEPGHSWRHRPWDASAPAVPTGLASLLYAVNLVELFDLGRFAAGSTPWAVVESLGRWLLRDLPAGVRRPLLADPLFPLLAELDTRPPDVANPVRLGAAVRPVRRFLAQHGLDAGTFTRPGSVLVSRTHVDVVLGLGEIDIDARLAGLDRDPGWLPALGRIVLFHFDGGSTDVRGGGAP
ncbi:hypothetical protein GCM10028801_38160 [Nocardioides maradonensis]